MMMKSRNGLEIHLFGSPRIIREGGIVPLSRRKTFGLLAYLVFSQRQIRRDRLADLFWPDEDAGHARGSLRVVLSEIHKIISPEIFPVSGETAGPLNPAGVSADVEEFQELLARVRLARRRKDGGASGPAEAEKNLLLKAAALYTGDFMDGFSLKECREFSGWQLQQEEYLRRELCSALGLLAEICEHSGDWEEGILHCRRLVREDGLNEDAHCTLMRLYSASGQRASALNQFRLCRQILQEELQLGPEESTVELYESILHSRPVRKQASPGFSPDKPRLAVLPFKSLSPEQDWFSDAMTDALITELSGRKGLEVISYNSSRRFRNTEKSMRQVASELNVHHLLEGAVIRAGEEVRISARLVEAAGDRIIWAESYHGRLSGILNLQEEIARTITGQVTGELAGEPEAPPPEEPLSGAREACLRGDYWLRKSESEEGVNRAREFYEQAALLDPGCADAFAGLAFTYFSILCGGRELVPTDDSRQKVRLYIRKALEIHPENVRARMVLAGSLWEWDFDFAAAGREFEEILRIHPRHIETLCWYSELKLVQGEIGEMLALVRRAYSLDPFDIVTIDHQYRYFIATLQYRRCMEILSRIDSLFPGLSHTSFLRSILHMRLGQFETAAGHIEKALSVMPLYDAYRNVQALAYAGCGRRDEALQVISGMLRDREEGKPVRAYELSLAYHAVGMDEEALKWLEQSLREDRLYTTDALSQPFFGELHWDPRYQEILRNLGLPHQQEYVRKALERQREGNPSIR